MADSVPVTPVAKETPAATMTTPVVTKETPAATMATPVLTPQAGQKPAATGNKKEVKNATNSSRGNKGRSK